MSVGTCCGQLSSLGDRQKVLILHETVCRVESPTCSTVGNVNILSQEFAMGDWEVSTVSFPSKCGGGVHAADGRGGGGGNESIT